MTFSNTDNLGSSAPACCVQMAFCWKIYNERKGQKGKEQENITSEDGNRVFSLRLVSLKQNCIHVAG